MEFEQAQRAIIAGAKGALNEAMLVQFRETIDFVRVRVEKEAKLAGKETDSDWKEKKLRALFQEELVAKIADRNSAGSTSKGGSRSKVGSSEEAYNGSSEGFNLDEIGTDKPAPRRRGKK